MKVIQVIPSFALAGAENMCATLTLELANLGCEICAISLYDVHSALTEKLEQNGIRIYYLGKKRGFDHSIIRKISSIYKKEKPDVVHSHLYATPYAMIPAIRIGIGKRIYTLHSVAQEESTNLGKRVNKFLFRHRVVPVALSGLVQDSAVRVYGLPKSRIPIVFNGVKLENCLPKNDYELHGDFKIIHVGSLSPRKNHLCLIAAFKSFHDRHPESELWLIGEGAERRAIENCIAANGLAGNVKLFGLQSNVYPYLHEADVFALPSIYEGMPMSIIEAMGTGLPIVATSVGGIPDMIENGKEGILVENKAESLAEAFEEYYCSENLREERGQKAKERAQEFSATAMAEQYLKIYKK